MMTCISREMSGVGGILVVLLFLFRDVFDSSCFCVFAFHSTNKGIGNIPKASSSTPSLATTSIHRSSTTLLSVDLDTNSVRTTTNNDIQPSSTSSPFENFDYEDQWYPCIWERDLELLEPTKVTIFDVDYVIARISNDEVVAMPDSCTHKGAALSEGRVTASGNFQCAYHGWSFNGKTGDCIEIPQIIQTKDDGKQTSATIPSRACTTAVPAQIHDGMVWLFPGGGLEKALMAPPPPSRPAELDHLKLSTVVRDMPVDFPILISNICDPDHGLFAHQSTNFDMYTASLDCPFESFVSEETDGGKGWSLRTKIDSKDKIIEIDQSLRQRLDPNPKLNKKSNRKDDAKPAPTTPWATFHFQAPVFARMNRIDKETGESKFATLFYVCPVGVGRSRFMAASLSGMQLPRWMMHYTFSNFVDQDTYLLATQQRNILSKEAEELRALMKEKGINRDDTEKVKGLKLYTRRNNFCLPSPTDKISSKIEQFWDITLSRCPNRVKHLLNLDESGELLQTPSREVVLDRKTQNLDICKDSRGVVRNCYRTKRATRIISIVLALGKFASLGSKPSGLLKFFMKNSSLVSMFAALFLVSSLANRLEKEYYFKYTDDFRRRDLKKIPTKIWIDK
jgi:phenylpropionate dioxygenase-like ring-hydroxylating dioxygenase large terminal subunit